MAALKKIWGTELKLGPAILGFTVFVIFTIVAVSLFFQTNSEADHDRSEQQATVLWGFALDAYQSSIDNYVDCKRSVDGRENVRSSIFGIYDFIIRIGEAGGERSKKFVADTKAARDKFDRGLPSLDSEACIKPEAPVPPAELPDNFPIQLPTIPKEYQ